MDINGNILKEIIYTNGLITLESHTLRNDKNIIKFQKKDGDLNGKWINSYTNGNIAEMGNYTQNKRDGKWEGWYETGYKKYECIYINGNKSGLYQEWDLKGKIIKNITYSFGQRIKEYEVVKDGTGLWKLIKNMVF